MSSLYYWSNGYYRIRERAVDSQKPIMLVDYAENNSTYDFNSIFMGAKKIETEFQEQVDEDDYLENSLNCLREIGNLHLELWGFSTKTDEFGLVELPCEAVQIEYVSSGTFDFHSNSLWNNLSEFFPSGAYVPFNFIENPIVENNGVQTQKEGKFIQVPYQNSNISIAYHTYKQDENGLPLVTEAEAKACAMWWIFIDAKRKMRKGNPLASQYYPIARRDMQQYVNQARASGEKFSQNFMDQYLNILVSHNRKTYNRSAKPIVLR